MEQYPIAYRLPLEKLKQGIFQKGEGWNSSYVLVNEIKIFRVNVIGTVISKDVTQRFENFIIDDGTSHILIRSFEPMPMSESFEMGALIRIIGNVRQYGNDIYLVPLCIRIVQDKGWIDLHKKLFPMWILAEKKQEIKIEQKEEPTNYVQILRSMDKGAGVPLLEFKKHIPQNPEKIIQELLRQGDIFEIRPGFIKSLY